MASIRKRPSTSKTGRPQRRPWEVSYRDADGNQHAESFASMAEAKQRKARVEQELHQGTYIDTSRSGRSFAMYVAEWFPLYSIGVRASSAKKMRSHLDTHLLPYFGRYPLSKISEREWQTFLGYLVERGLSPASISSIVGSLTVVMNHAVRQKYLAASSKPKPFRLPADTAPEAVFLTHPEVAQLVAAMPAQYGALVQLLGYTGLRWSEMAGLTRKRVDFLAKRLTVAESFTDGEFGLTKTKASRRTIGLSTATVEALAEHLRLHRPDIGPDDFLFTTAAGRGLDDNHFRARVWRPAVAAAGLGDRGLTPHDLRHTHAAHLIAARWQPKAIQVRLGHASIRITLDTYGHLFPGSDEAGLDDLDADAGKALAKAPGNLRRIS